MFLVTVSVSTPEVGKHIFFYLIVVVQQKAEYEVLPYFVGNHVSLSLSF